jgi:PhnB protein
MLFGSDVVGKWAEGFVQGSNFSISVAADSLEEAQKLFDGLSEGGRVDMPLGPTFWSPAFGMLCDRFGINWLVGFDGE